MYILSQPRCLPFLHSGCDPVSTLCVSPWQISALRLSQPPRVPGATDPSPVWFDVDEVNETNLQRVNHGSQDGFTHAGEDRDLFVNASSILSSALMLSVLMGGYQTWAAGSHGAVSTKLSRFVNVHRQKQTQPIIPAVRDGRTMLYCCQHTG